MAKTAYRIVMRFFGFGGGMRMVPRKKLSTDSANAGSDNINVAISCESANAAKSFCKVKLAYYALLGLAAKGV
ncbi:MAG: hypothetical protein FWG10_05995 [Eubacteriaceae bacterium]|nr:hypothetical protein [Eubacteriaceae bacterium]